MPEPAALAVWRLAGGDDCIPGHGSGRRHCSERRQPPGVTKAPSRTGAGPNGGYSLQPVEGLRPQELLIVLVIVLVLFGGKKLPELARNLGKAQRELRAGFDEGVKSDKDDDKPAKPGKGDTVQNDTVSDRTVQNDTVSDRTVQNDTVSDSTMSDGTVSNSAVSPEVEQQSDKLV
jgi:sec-independent protein translocase protein TatA